MVQETDKRFANSPDAGDPLCGCSRCGRKILAREFVMRCYDDETNEEYRYCPYCTKKAGITFPEDPDWDDFVDDDDDDFDHCATCDQPDACSDFGCAIKKGLRQDPDTW